MKIKTLLPAIAVVAFGLGGCYNDKEELLYPKTADCNNPAIAPGPLFHKVDSLISVSCAGGGCHTNGGNQKGFSFDNDCNIVNSWADIKRTCITLPSNDPKSMPYQSPFNTTQKKIITDWLDAGHEYID